MGTDLICIVLVNVSSVIILGSDGDHLVYLTAFRQRKPELAEDKPPKQVSLPTINRLSC